MEHARPVPARRSIVVAASILLFGLLFVLRLRVENPEEAILYLLVVPILLLAFEFGLAGGLTGAVVSILLLASWDRINEVGLTVTGYAARSIVYLAVGSTAGVFVRARRAFEEESTLWFETTEDLHCIASLDGRFLRVNRAWETTLGHRRADLLGAAFVGFVHPDDVEQTEAEAGRLVEDTYRSVAFRNRYRAADGSWRWLEWTGRRVPGRNAIFASARDITRQKELEEELEQLATIDQLTGLDNARHCFERIAVELQHLDRYGTEAAMLLFDCDGFKLVNDTLGHRAGDELLATIGHLVRARARATDVCARLGGDEFAVFLPESGERQATVVAQALADEIRNHPVPGSDLGVTLSIGIAVVHAGFHDVEALVQAADGAMYEAKRAGGDRWIIATMEGEGGPPTGDRRDRRGGSGGVT